MPLLYHLQPALLSVHLYNWRRSLTCRCIQASRQYQLFLHFESIAGYLKASTQAAHSLNLHPPYNALCYRHRILPYLYAHCVASLRLNYEYIQLFHFSKSQYDPYAGVVAAGLLDDLTTNDWEWTIGVNLWSVIHGIQIFLPLIKESGEGHIVNTSSSEGLQASAGTGAYNVTKFGIVALSETLSNELNLFPEINASVLCPGPVRSRIVESERNRPERLWNDGTPAAGLVENDQSSDLLAGAMDPAHVAELVVQSIQTNRFWIITHEETKEVVRQRAAALLEDGSLSAPLYDFSE